jgi:uncharacterized protein (TIGR02145 family)
MKNLFYAGFVCVMAMCFISCEKEKLPSVSTKDVVEITSTTAQCGGIIIDDGGTAIISKGVVWSALEEPTIENHNGITAEGVGFNSFDSDITGLFPNTLYFIRAYAINSIGVAYGTQMQFSTLGENPQVTTMNLTNITSNSVVANVSVVSAGGLAIISKGVVWGINENPTTSINDGIEISSSTESTFACNVNGLTPLTNYYVRAFATNSIGTSYGQQLQFCTTGELPTITTLNITSIAHNFAIASGDVISEGSFPVTSRGIVYASFENPTLSDNQVMVESGEGSGMFTCNLTNLSSETKYYVRAFATSYLGTSYGSNFEFTTLEAPNSTLVYDIDGNPYNTVTIGNQIWLKENLRVTKYNDGTDIVNTGANVLNWINNTTGAFNWYDYDVNNKEPYGALYNKKLVDLNSNGTKNVCPIGWHIPTDAEWTELVTFLDPTAIANVSSGNQSLTAGSALKSTGNINDETGLWEYPNTDATNLSGFSALPSGFRDDLAMFDGMGYVGGWWSTTPVGEYEFWVRYVYNTGGNIKRTTLSIYNGLAIRCIKD